MKIIDIDGSHSTPSIQLGEQGTVPLGMTPRRIEVDIGDKPDRRRKRIVGNRADLSRPHAHPSQLSGDLAHECTHPFLVAATFGKRRPQGVQAALDITHRRSGNRSHDTSCQQGRNRNGNKHCPGWP